jgi:hypothetical protein
MCPAATAAKESTGEPVRGLHPGTRKYPDHVTMRPARSPAADQALVVARSHGSDQPPGFVALYKVHEIVRDIDPTRTLMQAAGISATQLKRFTQTVGKWFGSLLGHR